MRIDEERGDSCESTRERRRWWIVQSVPRDGAREKEEARPRENLFHLWHGTRWRMKKEREEEPKRGKERRRGHGRIGLLLIEEHEVALCGCTGETISRLFSVAITYHRTRLLCNLLSTSNKFSSARAIVVIQLLQHCPMKFQLAHISKSLTNRSQMIVSNDVITIYIYLQSIVWESITNDKSFFMIFKEIFTLYSCYCLRICNQQ